MNKNKLKGNDLSELSTKCPKLYKLKVEDNEIESIDTFKALANLKIKKLNVSGNPLAKKEDYAKSFFEIFATLESIDDHDKNGKEVESTVYGEEDGDEEFDEAEDDDDDEDDDMEDEEEDDEGEDGEELENKLDEEIVKDVKETKKPAPKKKGKEPKEPKEAKEKPSSDGKKKNKKKKE